MNSDTISRQAVLNTTFTTLRITGKENAETVYKYIKKLCDDIKALPPAQTEPEAVFEWKKEFKEYIESLDITRDEWKGIIEYIDDVPTVQPDNDRLERCRFEYINACKIVTYPTPDTTKKDIADAYAVVRALNPIFGEEGF